jgi:phage terminase small subunit
MTLKQRRLIKEVMKPENKTLMDAGKKAGYSPIAGNIYRENIKGLILKALEGRELTKEKLKDAYEHLLKLTINDKDHSTSKGILDSEAKLYKLLSDNNNQQAIIFTSDMIKELQGLSVDNSTPETIDTQADT